MQETKTEHEIRKEKVEALIRKGEQEFKDLNLDSSQLEDIDFLADCIASYPKIMQRPIIIKGNKGIIARPPEKIFDIL